MARQRASAQAAGPAVPARPAARLSRGRIVETAVAIADGEGLDAVSMRRLGQQLQVDPMSLYRYIGDKDGLLDAMVDAVLAEIRPVTDAATWIESARATMLAARAVMARHPWTAELVKGRPQPTPGGLRHLDTVLGILREAGFSVDQTHHAIHVLGSRILGFSQDLYDDGPNIRQPPEAAQVQALQWASSHPWLAELALATSHDGPLGGCDDDEEFRFSVDLILEGLERRRRGPA